MGLSDPDNHRDHFEAAPEADLPEDFTSPLGSALNRGTLPSQPLVLTDLFEKFAPVSVTFTAVSVFDAANKVLDVLFPQASHSRLKPAVEHLLERIADSRPVRTEDAAALTPSSGDISIREIKSVTATNGRLTERSSTEFARTRGAGPGCTVELAPSDQGRSLDLKLDWGHDLPFQSSHSISERWGFAEEAINDLVGVDPEQDAVTPIDADERLFVVLQRVTIAVAPRDPACADITTDKHLSIRPDLIALCALRPRCDEDEPAFLIEDRLSRLHERISQLCPDIGTRAYSDEYTLSRSDLERCGHVPFLISSGKELEAIVVENFILIATRDSTGYSLLEDIAALERFAFRASMPEAPPALDSLDSVEVLDLPPAVGVSLCAALAVPTRDFLLAGLKEFVECESPESLAEIRDGLIFAARDKMPASAKMIRTFDITGDDLADYEHDEDAEEEDDDERAPWAAESHDNVQVSREAKLAPIAPLAPSRPPMLRFFTARGGEGADLLASHFADGVGAFALSIQPNGAPETTLPEPLVRTLLEGIGIDPGRLEVAAYDDELTHSRRVSYLSKNARLVFRL